MLLSMTGFGEAHCQRDGLAVAVEVRTINSRFFKLSVRTTEGYGLLDPQVESLVRKSVRRGTIQVNVRIDRHHSPEDYKIDADVLRRYRAQLEMLQHQWNIKESVPLTALLPLPGVVAEASFIAHDVTEDWPAVSETVQAALANLAHMRAEEGRVMAADLKGNCRRIAEGVEQIELRVPQVVETYRTKLQERLTKILAEFEVALAPADVIREVSLMADRADISEEVVRLRSHVDQFESIMDLPESSGRKLEFLTQEMVREANTIGSKVGDLETARGVIDIKAAIERIREMIQNVE